MKVKFCNEIHDVANDITLENLLKLTDNSDFSSKDKTVIVNGLMVSSKKVSDIVLQEGDEIILATLAIGG